MKSTDIIGNKTLQIQYSIITHQNHQINSKGTNLFQCMVIQFVFVAILIQMRKQSVVKEEDEVHSCQYCGDVAELMCGKCEEVYYCKYDHQRADWNKHSRNCNSIEDKRKQHFQNKRMRKSQIFEYLSKPDVTKAVSIVNKLVETEKSFILKLGDRDLQTQIQLGSSVCVNIRLLIASKEFSTAQDILHDYFKEKNGFLSDISNICSKEELDALSSSAKERQIYLISGKLRLISTLANLMHELIRNSVDMFEILISHTQKVFGSDSLELSNTYFYTANYLNFLNQSSKALACFLKCAKLRKQKGGTAYYNVALLLLKANRKKKALQYFQKALELIQQEKNQDNSYVIPQIYQNIALINLDLGLVRQMMDYFQKAYFFYQRTQNKPKADAIIKLFMTIRAESKQEGSEDVKMIQFIKERKDKKPNVSLSSKNYQNFKNADKAAQEDERKTNEWITSFKELKLNYNQPSPVKYPVKQLEYLFGVQTSKNGEEESPSYMVNNSDSLGLSEGVNMDVQYMQCLTSNEVGYLHELNRLLMECRERAAVYDIVENSNFYQAVDKDKLKKFYRLNSGLVRPSDLELRITMLEKVEEDEDQYEYEATQPKKAVVAPKLDLTKLKSQRINDM